MWIRIAVSPWWVRGLLTASLGAFAFGPFWALMQDDGDFNLRSLPRIIQWAVSTAAFTILLLAAQQPTYRRLVAPLQGLTRAQRSRAISSLAQGAPPVDPAALSAAIRLGTIMTGMRRRAPAWIVKLQWILPLVFIPMAVGSFRQGDVRRGLTWTGIAAFMAAMLVLDYRRQRRLAARVELLSRAGESKLTEQPVVLESDYPPVWPSRRILLVMIAVCLILGIVIAVMEYRASHTRHDCAVARDAVRTIVTNHVNLTDGRSILPGGPSLDDYQSWSGTLSRRAASTSRPDFAPHLRRLADLSEKAVSIVREERAAPSVSEPDRIHRQSAYQSIVIEMLNESEALLKPLKAVC